MYRYLYLGLFLAVLPVSSGCSPQNSEAQTNKDGMIRDALRGAMPSISDKAAIKDWEGNTLREGSSGYVCYPTPPGSPAESSPMCLDKTWQEWVDAWMNKRDPKITSIGIGYMLQGDTGASNTDPFATAQTADNQWVVTPAHIMVLTPDRQQLDTLPTDPNNGGPWVMWKGTPYAHIMVPTVAMP